MKSLVFFTFVAALFLIGCGGKKKYAPEKGSFELKLKATKELPTGQNVRKFSAVMAPGGNLFYSWKGPEVLGADEEQELVVMIKPSGEKKVILKVRDLWDFPYLFWADGSIWALTTREVVKISPEGEVLKKSALSNFYDHLAPVEEGGFLGDALKFPKEGPVHRILYYIRPFGISKKVLVDSVRAGAIEVKTPKGISAIYVPEYVPSLLWAYSPWTGHIVVGESDSYRFKIMTPEGKKVKEFGFKFERAEFPLEAKKKVAPKLLFWGPKDRQKAVDMIVKALPERLPAFKRLLPLPSGYFMVEAVEALGKTHWDVLSEKGHLLYSFNLPSGLILIGVLSDGSVVFRRDGVYYLGRAEELKEVFEPRE